MTDVSCAPRLLLVDDNERFRRSMAMVLQSKGFDVSCSDGREELAAAVRIADPALILLDYHVDGRLGSDLFREVRALEPVPVILLTAHRDYDLIDSCLDAGFNDVLFKPVDSDELAARVRSVLRRQSRRPSTSAAEARHETSGVARYGDLVIDGANSMIAGTNGESRLPPTELTLLRALLRAAPGAVHREDLCREALRRKWMVGDRTIDVLISRIRKKLDRLSRCVEVASRRGHGYALQQRSTPSQAELFQLNPDEPSEKGQQ